MLPHIFTCLPPSGQTTPCRYIRRKAWMIRQDKFDLRGTGLMRDMRMLPGLPKRRLLAFWRDKISGKADTLDLPFAYDAFQVNDGAFRLRAFDIGKKETIKIVRRDSPYGPGTLCELNARAGFLQQTALKIPAIYDRHLGDDYIHFHEQMLMGRTFHAWLDAPRFMEQVGTPFLALYRSYGLSQKPLVESMKPDQVDRIMRDLSGNPRIAAAKKLLEENKLVSTTISHGDLLCSNMIVTKDGVYVIDWEKSLETYAGYDFARLALRYPANPVFRRAALEALAAFQDHNGLTLAEIGILRDATIGAPTA